VPVPGASEWTTCHDEARHAVESCVTPSGLEPEITP
jgi:hypothetical protein